MDLENNDGQPADTSVDASTAPEDNSSEGDNSTPASKQEETTPTLLAGKYKSVEDLEKGYRESTKYGRELNDKIKGFESFKAPEEYTFDFKDVEGLSDIDITPDDPDMKAMIPVFKELNGGRGLSNEDANKLVQAHLNNMASLTETPEQIKDQLGSNADVIITKLQEFTNDLPEQDQLIMQALSDTSAGVDFLYRHLIGGELPTPGPTQDGSSAPQSSSELYKIAFDFKKDRAKSIGFSKSEQDEYSKLMKTALIAEQNEKKAKK